MGYHCDNCEQLIHRDRNDYWVGEDETSDCPVNDDGHKYDGKIR